jgi:hypothetical protein
MLNEASFIWFKRSKWPKLRQSSVMPNPFIERTSPGKPGASHIIRQAQRAPTPASGHSVQSSLLTVTQIKYQTQTMLLPHDQAMRFIEGYKAVLLQVLRMSGKSKAGSVIEKLAAARTLAKENMRVIELAISELESQGQVIDATVAEAIRTMRVMQWVYLRHTKTAAIFIDKDVEDAFAVNALTTPIFEIVEEPPAAFEAGVFQYLGKYVCDGIVLNPVLLGPGYKAQFNAAYSAIRKAGRFHAKPSV